MSLKANAERAIAAISADFVRRRLGPVTEDQRACIFDHARTEEALGMLDDWIVRLGARIDDIEDITDYLGYRSVD